MFAEAAHDLCRHWPQPQRPLFRHRRRGKPKAGGLGGNNGSIKFKIGRRSAQRQREKEAEWARLQAIKEWHKKMAAGLL